MKKDMIWAHMIRISNHMWGDGSTQPYSIWYNAPKSYEDTDPNNIDIATWDETIKFMAERKFNMLLIDIGDGVQFESHPEISAPDAWSKEFLKQKLDEARALGLEVIPKLNFSTCHDTWLKEYRRMISTPIYYKVCSDLIAEMCELFDHPRYFHIGFDEEVFMHQVTHEMIIIRNEKLFWHDAFFLFKECEKNGARPWVWSDYYWNHPDVFLKNMPKEVLQSNWNYDRFENFDPNSREYIFLKAYEDLDKAGYEQVPTCASFSCPHNAWQTAAHVKERLNPELVLGMMTCPWCDTKKDFEYLLKWDIDRFYQARIQYYPETL